MGDYPEHEKMRAVRTEHHALVSFMEWYTEWRQRDDLSADFMTCDYDESAAASSGLIRTMSGIEERDSEEFAALRPLYLHEMGDRQRASLIANYFEVDEKAFDAEKEAMLEELRTMQEQA